MNQEGYSNKKLIEKGKTLGQDWGSATKGSFLIVLLLLVIVIVSYLMNR